MDDVVARSEESLDRPPPRLDVQDSFADLAERCRSIRDLYIVVSCLAPHDPRLLTVAALEQQALEAVRKFPDKGAVELIHQILLDAESRLLDIEGHVSKHDFTTPFEEAAFPPEVILHYVRALAQRSSGQLDRPARVRHGLGSLLMRRQPGGPTLLADEGDIQLLLQYVFAGSKASDDARASTRTFLAKSSDRLRHITSVSEIFDTGLYADIVGFEIALRERLLDPEIAYGSLRLSTCFMNRLGELAVQEEVAPAALFARMSQVRADLDKVFADEAPATRAPSSGDLPGRERRKSTIQQEKVPKKWRTWIPDTWGRWIGWSTLLLGSLVITGTMYQLLLGSSSVGKDALGQISPIIVEAYVANARPKTLFGKLDAKKWGTLSRDEKHAIAQDIKDKLQTGAKVQNAVLHADEQLAIQIEATRLKYVK